MSGKIDDRPFAERLVGEPNVVTPIRMWQPTARLRWSREGTLQQAWCSLDSLEVEWRDVPTEGGDTSFTRLHTDEVQERLTREEE